MVNKEYCMSSYLIYRYVVDCNMRFTENLTPSFFKPDGNRFYVNSENDTDNAIATVINKTLTDGKCALMLSGGIDSAILAKYLPKGTLTYTLRCVADGAIDETEQALKYANECGLDNKIIDVTWEDYNEYSRILMKHKGAPIHSIEPQIYKAAVTARKDGVKNLIFGENADMIFGGLDGLFSKDWTFDEFVQRYMYLDPVKVLHNGTRITEPFEKYRQGNSIDFYKFICDFFYMEANGSYDNACQTAGVNYISPFNRMVLNTPLDYKRIRNGESKYILRNLFKEKYNTEKVPKKTPLPRAVSQWLADWEGPKRDEFISGCTNNMTGDQKWLVYCLERFLKLIDDLD